MIHETSTIDYESDNIVPAQVSKALFGNQDRLPVGAAVASSPDDLVFARELALKLGIADSRVTLQLAAFEKAGLLERLPKTSGSERRVFYRRRNSVFWHMCAALLQEVSPGAHESGSPPPERVLR